MIDRPPAPAANNTLATCPVCQGRFVVHGKQLYCGKPCRDTAYRRRKHSAIRRIPQPPTRPRRGLSVYECEGCGKRSLGYERCEQCRKFLRKLGLGGSCPYCDEPVTVTDLLKEEVAPRGIR
ncbi:MAG: hypothetical protein ACT4OM_11915 [Actinomycetota bacterium]